MASSSCRSVALFLRRATILRSALTSKPVALASRYLSRMSPLSAFFSSSSRSICSTNWRSCFCAETCSVVMDPPPSDQPRTSEGVADEDATQPGFPRTPRRGATLAVRHRPCKALRSAIQRFWPEVLARGFGQRFWPEHLARGFGQGFWPGPQDWTRELATGLGRKGAREFGQ